jgi:release factor glutamine methyltransferase
MNQNTVTHALTQARLQLSSDEAKLEAQVLLQQVLNVSHAWLISHANDVLEAHQLEAFHVLVQRRLNGEPIAYILGQREFYGLNLTVTSDTLIPRPDTETLVEAALAKLTNNQATVLDLGTGTGAIALAVAKHRPMTHVTAVDFSATALKVAAQNAKQLNITNITFVESHWFDALAPTPFDIVISNPPYIEHNDAHLSQGDLRFEPLTALASGADGLDDIRQIINDCLVYLKPQGWLMLEHGYNQAEAVADLMAGVGLSNIETIQDLGGNDRVTLGKNPLIVSTHWR